MSDPTHAPTLAPADPAARAADALLAARREHTRLAALPPGTAPQDRDAAYAIQRLVAERLGNVAGWKVGAATPTAEPFLAPLHATTIRPAGARIDASGLHRIGVEAELVYTLAHDLPPRPQPYTRAEMLAAVAGLHPALELIDSRFAELAATAPLTQLADQQNHGALIVGDGVPDWHGIDAATAEVRLSLDGTVRAEGPGGNSAGDPVRLLVWLANVGSRPWGGLRAGQAVTTGSCTGTIFVERGTRVAVSFAGLGGFASLIA